MRSMFTLVDAGDRPISRFLRHWQLVPVLAAILACVVDTTWARDYYVRPDGNDSQSGTTNSASSAFRTIKKCSQVVRAGDRCLIQPGTYREFGVEPTYGGTKTDNVMSNCSCTKGSSTVTCASNVSGVNAGDFVQCDAGYGFFWTEVAATSGSTISLIEPYRGQTSSSDTLDVAKLVQFIGANGTSPAAAGDVVLTSFHPQPSDVRWTSEGGCVYSYPLASTTDPVWSVAQGFREVVPFSSWDLYDDNKNGLDSYEKLSAGACPCASPGNVATVESVPGSWSTDGSKIYLQTRTCQNPDNLTMEAGSRGSYHNVLNISKPFTMVRSLVVESNAADDGSSAAYTWALNVSANNNVAIRDVRCQNGRCGMGASGSYADILFYNVRSLRGFAAGGGTGHTGLHFVNLEVRGGYPNMLSVDDYSGAGPDDPIIFDRFYLHRAFTQKRSSVCGEQDLWDCSSKSYLPSAKYYGVHGFYMGNASLARTLNNILFQNCIVEITYDGLGVFLPAGSNNVTIRNCTFQSGEYVAVGSTAAPGGGVKIYNSLWHCPSGSCGRQVYVYGGDDSNIVSDYNAYLYDNNNGENIPATKTHWTGTKRTINDVANVRGQERHSIVACSSGCSSSVVPVFNDGLNASRLVDTRTDDGDGTDYTPLAGSRVIDAGLNSQCPDTDFYGNPRNDGRCDIGAVEYQGGVPDTTPPASVANFETRGEDSAVALSWNQSPSQDAVGAIVRVRTDRHPSSSTDGAEACRRESAPSTATSCRFSPASNGVTYYFSAFSYDRAGNYGSAVTSQAVPNPPPAPDPVSGVTRTDKRGE